MSVTIAILILVFLMLVIIGGPAVYHFGWKAGFKEAKDILLSGRGET